MEGRVEGVAWATSEDCMCYSLREVLCSVTGAVSVTAGTPAAPEREGHMLQVEERVGPIKGHEDQAQYDDTHEYILHAHRGGGCPMQLDCCYLTACSDTQCNVCTTRLQLYVRIGVQCETDMRQRNKQTSTSFHLWQLSSFHAHQTRGSMEQ